MTTPVIAEIVLMKDGHNSRDEGVCLLEAVAWVAGEPHGDHPACVDPAIAAYGRALNDAMPDDQRQRLKPYIPQMIGTAGASTEVNVKRAMLCADRAVRVFAAAALKAAGLNEWGDKLAALDPVTDKQSAKSAAKSANSAESAKSAAKSANSAESAESAESDPWAEPIKLLEDLIAIK